LGGVVLFLDEHHIKVVLARMVSLRCIGSTRVGSRRYA
jgi:hypothetical protein